MQDEEISWEKKQVKIVDKFCKLFRDGDFKGSVLREDVGNPKDFLRTFLNKAGQAPWAARKAFCGDLRKNYKITFH